MRTITKQNKKDFMEGYLEFAKLAKGYLRPPSSRRTYYNTYTRYSKQEILELLNYPDKNEKQLRNASIYLYNISSHYRRLIGYFAGMPTYDYYLTPLKLDSSTRINVKSLRSCYKKAADQIELMNLKHELIKVAKTCFREDVFFGYEFETKDSYFIQKLNPDYCRIVAIEDGTPVFEFDFSFFSSRSELLPYYGSEFQRKYELYQKDRLNSQWQELDSKHAVCFKLNEDLSYIIPPFAGTFPDIYDIADYKTLMKAKTETGNYKLVTMKIPFENGEYQLPNELITSYYNQLADQLPDRIGLGAAPMDLDTLDFESSGSTQDTDEVAKSESAFWSSSGASSAILGKSDVTSSSAIMLSIETDAQMVYGLLRQFERWINKKLKQLSGTYHFKLTFLNISGFNQTSVQEALLKGCQYGFPLRLPTAAACGYSPSDFTGALVLENQILNLQEQMVPVSSTHTQSSTAESSGRPKQETVDEAGEHTEESDANDR